MGTKNVARAPRPRTLSRKGNEVGRDPLMNQGEAKLTLLHCPNHEFESGVAAYIDIESVYQQKRVHPRKPYAFVAVHKGVIIDQRLQQRRRLFARSSTLPHYRLID